MAKCRCLPTTLPRICLVPRTNWVSRLSYGVMLTFWKYFTERRQDYTAVNELVN